MIPRATYRLQLHRQFGFDQVAALLPYLKRLGISHLYLSPYLKARPGSSHGYDIVDHSHLNPELGDEHALGRLAEASRLLGLGQILDVVPNHMGVGGADNPLWLDVLEWGPEAEHAGWFDIDWDPERRYLHNKVLVPLLAAQYGSELERGVLRLKFDPAEGSFAVWAYDTHKLPIFPPHYGRILGDGHSELERLGDAFAWLPQWRLHMARRAAELKLELSALVRDREDVRAALELAVQHFAGTAGQADSWRSLDALIADQNWRVAHFRVAADDINYRRFFNINDLAGLRMELPEVFDHAHQRVLHLIRNGVLDGLRIDHIDGLFDPCSYLRRLHRRIGSRRPRGHFYLVVEKVLAAHEQLREEWPVDGTTGYDFLNQCTELLIDPASEAAFSQLYAEFSGEHRAFAEIVRLSKLHIMSNEMAGELNVIARSAARLARQNPRTADFTQNLLRRAIQELIACFPVYRTYVDARAAPDAADQRDFSWALAQARRNETEIDPSVFDFLEQLLTARLIQQPHSGFSRQALLHCAMRLQQYSGPVMAKGLEDTAFYRYYRFVALNEVGGDPSRFGNSTAAFHRAQQQRAQRWPYAMLASSTHDTKRGEDARARLAALSEFPDEWAQQLPIWGRILRGPPSGVADRLQPDRNDEYLFYQLLLASWPAELLELDGTADTNALQELAARVRGTLLKSAREARVHTSWAFPNAEYEQAIGAFIDAALIGARSGAFLPAFLPLARLIAEAGLQNSLVQTVLKLTVPGVPDLYNGTELWDLSMVDPDNRRPVDYALRGRLLTELEAALREDRAAALRQRLHDWRDGTIKLALIVTLLQHRGTWPDLYGTHDYQPLEAHGAAADQICAFTRSHAGAMLLVAVARHPRRRQAQPLDATSSLTLPSASQAGPWQELLTGRSIAVDGLTLALAPLFEVLPAAVLFRPAPEQTQ